MARIQYFEKGSPTRRRESPETFIQEKARNAKELRSTLGMWTYFSSFIPAYSINATPLLRQKG